MSVPVHEYSCDARKLEFAGFKPGSTLTGLYSYKK